jgi:lysophospholipase L1-like esterase
VRKVLGLAIIATFVAAAVLLAENIVIAALLPQTQSRLATDFSPAYLERDLDALQRPPSRIVLLGDSVVWGYHLPPDQTAASLLARRWPIANLAFKAGSPPNYYALVKVLLARGIRPQLIVLQVNPKTLNQADNAYQTLHPTLAALSFPLLDSGDRKLLSLKPPADDAAARADRFLTSVLLLYAMRSDIREALYGSRDPDPPIPTSTDAYEGTYDLAPLHEDNVGVHFLEETADTLRVAHVPVIAFLTPTNHALVHDYIDNPQYGANRAYVIRLLEARGVRVLDLDAAFPVAAFLDNDHLTASGQRRLAQSLAHVLPSPAP